jgi:hypothetical protein
LLLNFATNVADYTATIYSISTMPFTYIFFHTEADTAVESSPAKYQNNPISDRQHIHTYATVSKLKAIELRITTLAYFGNGLSDTVCL